MMSIQEHSREPSVRQYLRMILIKSGPMVNRCHCTRLSAVQVMLVCQSFGLLLGTVVMVPKTAQTVRLHSVDCQAPCVMCAA